MTKIIGLTGGIGSGKSTVAALLRDRKIPVYVADDEAREITETEEVLLQIRNRFGNDIFDGSTLNRAKLAGLVFRNAEKLEALNAIVHPAVRTHFKKWVLEHAREPIIVKEAAILFESGADADCDFIITIVAPEEDRITRVMQRDDATREQVLLRVQNQMSDAERIAKSDFIITNSSLPVMETQLTNILKKISKS